MAQIAQQTNTKNNNLELSKIFFEMADIFELQEIKWKPQAYRIAAQTIEALKQDIPKIYFERGEKGIEALPGIGEGIAKKIIQYIQQKKIDEYEKLKKTIPAGLYEMMNIPGVGPKKAKLFFEKLKIKNKNELEKAAKQHRLLKLPGFKEKSEQNILEGIKLLAESKGRIPLKDAQKIAEPIVKQIRKLDYVTQAIVAGSIRRKKSMVKDMDIVVEINSEKNFSEVIDKFTKMPFVKKVLGKGHEKATIITKENIQADIRPATKDFFGSCLLYFTGDKQHNIWLRKLAMKKGWKLSEYGLFNKDNKRIAGKTEKEIYDKLGIKFPQPEKRIGETQ
jgi:DNA polymerase (family 10)